MKQCRIPSFSTPKSPKGVWGKKIANKYFKELKCFSFEKHNAKNKVLNRSQSS
jgi:hypothetical protein